MARVNINTSAFSRPTSHRCGQGDAHVAARTRLEFGVYVVAGN